MEAQALLVKLSLFAHLAEGNTVQNTGYRQGTDRYFKAQVGKGCVVEPGARLLNGVKVPDGRYVPAGTVVTTQEQADNLPKITDNYPLKNLNQGVLHVNEQLAEGYLKAEKGAATEETKAH